MIPINVILFLMGLFIIVVMFYVMLKDMPDWDKTHHDHKTGSHYEITNRKDKK